MSPLKRLLSYYRASKENRIQLIIFLGFVVIPILGMGLLYILVRLFWL
ncbi:Uncharacterised protein [Legionella beliardensis]|uniref:Uncharacterized protein n=1 Tax=Legionella beliardensis TaxID=91822 RepID=A0A378I2C4_9GAMM|nr:hypothetical protein [Legionella beliardensis]STX28835.1 Uncharacterised protein [Legionella beliardensis]